MIRHEPLGPNAQAAISRGEYDYGLLELAYQQGQLDQSDFLRGLARREQWLDRKLCSRTVTRYREAYVSEKAKVAAKMRQILAI